MPAPQRSIRRLRSLATAAGAPPGRLTTLSLSVFALAAFLAAPSPAHAADEIHWTIMGPAAISFSWRGPETTIAFGTAPGAYTRSVTAVTPSPLPNSSAGPFWEARLTGLEPNTLYHYRLGAVESTFRTPPHRGHSGFWLAAQADVGSSLSYSGVVPQQRSIAQDHAQIEGDDRPRFVLVPGDLTYGDDRGRAHVDQHFNDVMVWSLWSAYMPTWGNHEWGSSVDDLQNYEGRFDLPNTQTSPNAPSSGGPGDDWYWFDYGNARFVAYPEPFSRAWDDWEIKAGAVMAQAQADTALDFIVVFGHRPPYSSGADHGGNESLAESMAAMKRLYPKFVMTMSGHSHHYERTDPAQTDSIVHIVSGGGGSTVGGLAASRPSWSAARLGHFQHVKLHVQHDRIEGYCVCGPDGGGADDACTPGTVVDRWTILAPGAVEDPDVGGGDGDPPAGNQPPVARLEVAPATGPAPLRVIADASGSTDPETGLLSFAFALGDGASQSTGLVNGVEHTFGPGTWTVSVIVTDALGLSDTASAVVTVTDVPADSLGPELVTNPSFEASTEGWTTYGRSAISRWPGGHHGQYSLNVRSLGFAELFGLGDHPNWVAEVPAAGVRYRVSAHLRSMATLGRCRLLVREFKEGERVGVASTPYLHLGSAWQKLTIEYETVSAGSHLDIQVLEDPVSVFESFMVDDISVRMRLDPATMQPLIAGAAPSARSPETALNGGAGPGAGFAPRVAPNPSFGNALLSFATARPGPLRVDLYDASGRLVRRLRDDPMLPAGRHQFALGGEAGARALTSGIYFCVVNSVRGRETVRVAVVR